MVCNIVRYKLNPFCFLCVTINTRAYEEKLLSQHDCAKSLEIHKALLAQAAASDSKQGAQPGDTQVVDPNPLAVVPYSPLPSTDPSQQATAVNKSTDVIDYSSLVANPVNLQGAAQLTHSYGALQVLGQGQLQGLSQGQLQALSQGQLQVLSQGQLQALGQGQLQALGQGQLQALGQGQLQAVPYPAGTPMYSYGSLQPFQVSSSFGYNLNSATPGSYQISGGLAQMAPTSTHLAGVPMGGSPMIKAIPVMGYGGMPCIDPHSAKVKTGVSLASAHRYAPY